MKGNQPHHWDLVPVAALTVMVTTTAAWLQQSRGHGPAVEERKEDHMTAGRCLPRGHTAEEAQRQGCSALLRRRIALRLTLTGTLGGGSEEAAPGSRVSLGCSTPDGEGSAVPLCSQPPALAQELLHP